jgi:hypothetical protein
MDLRIERSNIMDLEKRGNDGYEHRIVRIPSTIRVEHRIFVGDFIHLQNNNGDIETFQVDQAFKEDVDTDDTCAYVTTEVYNRIASESNIQDVERITGITLGCDPEAFIVDSTSGIPVGAYRYLPHNGEVGNDGMLLEFRPRPSTSALQVTANIWNLIKKSREILNAKREGSYLNILGASGYGGLTAGFHLHYGLPRGLLGRRPGTFNVAKLMTRVFDYYVGVPSIIPEGNRDISRRTGKFVRYGKPGEYRIDNRTFEFRMPGGINLAHPALTIGLMTLGAVVAEDIASRINGCTESFTDLSVLESALDICTLYPNLPGMQTFYAIICNPDIGLAKQHFQTVKSDVRQMVGYRDHAPIIEAYFDILDEDCVFSPNIEQNWGGFYNGEEQQGQVGVL